MSTAISPDHPYLPSSESKRYHVMKINQLSNFILVTLTVYSWIQVVQLLCQCTCPTQFPMVRIGDGKYKVGDKLIIFVRILRRHIMVRVGGGWQELSEFLRQKDPCRSKHHSSVFSMSSGTSSIVSTMMTSTPNNPTRIPSLTNSSAASRSRLLSSNSHLNRGYNNNGRIASGQKLISGSVSMSWLSHNSWSLCSRL